MSRSERAAVALVDEAVRRGMTEREASHWRAAVADPCGCAEGMTVGVFGAVVAAVAAGGPVSMVLWSGVGFAGGALVGKVVGVARGLRVVRFQRAQLERRVAEVTASVRRARSSASTAARAGSGWTGSTGRSGG